MFLQTAENGRQLRSRSEHILTVSQGGTPAVSSSPVALLDVCFERLNRREVEA